jgi:acyl-CoA synthetase (AMP-forming)/AMP-acid ligase II
MVGTAPFHEQLKKKFKKKFNVRCLESYGSSEMLLVSTNLINKSFGSGKILNGIRIKKDRNKNLLISSPFKFFGYLKKNRLIEINKDRYFNSGDTFKKRNQFIKIIGRTKEIIIKEGINISPKQIEDEFLKIKFVDEVGVIGVKHSLYGEVPVAFVKLNKKIDTDYIIKNLKKKLSEKLIPEEIISVNEIPKNRIGKIDKNKLKKKYDNRSRSFKS